MAPPGETTCAREFAEDGTGSRRGAGGEGWAKNEGQRCPGEGRHSSRAVTSAKVLRSGPLRRLCLGPLDL